MRSETLMRVFIGAFIVMFFAYLFGPLIIMSLSAFNSSEFPRVTPWDCFTFEWFGVLAADERLMDGLKNSLIIGIGVVCLAVPIGLAGAIMLTQVHHRVRPFYYTIVISPILMPGVVLGISTLIFWDRLGVMFDAGYQSFFYNGIFLTIIGQATFISAYSMLVFIARLQRFDPVLEEAALDLGATNVQAFRKVLLPFMKPAIGSAAVLAFLASFENYNTTVFTIVQESTLTTVLAGKVRLGINPSISALAVIIVALTLIGAIFVEMLKRREMAEAEARKREGAAPAAATGGRAAKANMLGNPMAILLVLITVAGLGTVWFAKSYDVSSCKADLKRERELKTLIESAPSQFLQKKELQEQERQKAGEQGTAPAAEAPAAGSADKPFSNIFDPNNLQQQVNPDAPENGGGASGDAESKPFGSIFDPNNLQQQVNPE